MKEAIQEGTLLHYAWGYDQTQCEFYAVVERRGSDAIVRRIRAVTVPGSEGFMCDKRRPDPRESIGEPFRKRVTPWGIKMGHGYATPTTEEKAYHCSWYG
jgi:hypothetical protein